MMNCKANNHVAFLARNQKANQDMEGNVNLEEAMAVYLYLRYAWRSSLDEHDFRQAWKTICDHAEKTIRTQLRHPPGDDATG